MTILLEIAVVAAIVFGAVAYILGQFDSMRPAPPESGAVGLPVGPLEPAAIDRTRFGLSFRGYRMDEVDAVLDRLRDELARREDGSGPAGDPDTAFGTESATESSTGPATEPKIAAEHDHVPAGGVSADGAEGSEGSEGSAEPAAGHAAAAAEPETPIVPQHEPGADEAPAGDPDGPWPS